MVETARDENAIMERVKMHRGHDVRVTKHRETVHSSRNKNVRNLLKCSFMIEEVPKYAP